MFKLNSDGTAANKIGTGEWHNVNSSVEYLDWLAAGNTPEPADPPPPVIIFSVTMRQARLALLAAGLLDDVDTAISGIADANQRKATEIEWEYAQEVRRDHQWVQNLATGMGLDLEELFQQAAAL